MPPPTTHGLGLQHVARHGHGQWNSVGRGHRVRVGKQSATQHRTGTRVRVRPRQWPSHSPKWSPMATLERRHRATRARTVAKEPLLPPASGRPSLSTDNIWYQQALSEKRGKTKFHFMRTRSRIIASGVQRNHDASLGGTGWRVCAAPPPPPPRPRTRVCSVRPPAPQLARPRSPPPASPGLDLTVLQSDASAADPAGPDARGADGKHISWFVEIQSLV